MAAGDVWDYIFGSYVNAARAPPYINDGVIVIRRLNARAPARARARASERVTSLRDSARLPSPPRVRARDWEAGWIDAARSGVALRRRIVKYGRQSRHLERGR